MNSFVQLIAKRDLVVFQNDTQGLVKLSHNSFSFLFFFLLPDIFICTSARTHTRLMKRKLLQIYGWIKRILLENNSKKKTRAACSHLSEDNHPCDPSLFQLWSVLASAIKWNQRLRQQPHFGSQELAPITAWHRHDDQRVTMEISSHLLSSVIQILITSLWTGDLSSLKKKTFFFSFPTLMCSLFAFCFTLLDPRSSSSSSSASDIQSLSVAEPTQRHKSSSAVTSYELPSNSHCMAPSAVT